MRRGLRGAKLVISEAHEGLKAAAAKVLKATWQRCRVHFMRNALAYANKTQRRMVSAAIATVFAQETAQDAHQQWACDRRPVPTYLAQAGQDDQRRRARGAVVHGLPASALAADPTRPTRWSGSLAMKLPVDAASPVIAVDQVVRVFSILRGPAVPDITSTITR
jgi:hypothetical protein